MLAVVCLKGHKRLVCGGVIGQCFVDGWRCINGRKPLRHMRNHLVHVLLARTEHDVLAAFVGDVAGKDLVQSLRLPQGAL